MENELYHRGTPHDGFIPHSGRYEYGSGENPEQHQMPSLKETVKRYKANGLTEKEIAQALEMSTTELRKQITVENAKSHAEEDSYILSLKEQGFSNVAIGEKIGKSESYVRARLNPKVQKNATVTNETVEVLKNSLKEHRYVDIGVGTNLWLGVSKAKFDAAVQEMVNQGYEVVNINVSQAGAKGLDGATKNTTVKVLAPAGEDKRSVWQNREEIGTIVNFYRTDGTRTVRGIEPPTYIDPSRVKVRYAEEGGISKDGVIEIRRGVKDLSLGNSNYAQVRIGVGGTHFLKGMAIYSDDVPDGYDIIFNTNKHRGTPMLGDKKTGTVLKNIKDDETNPFGATFKMKDGKIVGQSHYIDSDGKEKLSAVNIVREEGDWDTWSRTLASQFLSKQPLKLIEQQLNLTYAQKKTEYDRIASLTNPEVKRKLLMEFADKCDSSASELKAAALPRQSAKVILPLNNIKDNEIYAPTYKHGEKVALIRYPHGGTFEIPILTVNNKNVEGIRVLGKYTTDAVGINQTVAGVLSGADFDGDTVTVIPMANQDIKSTVGSLKGLKDFEPKEQYPEYEGMPLLDDSSTQIEMGKITNLITDMTLMGAKPEELERAVKHSMVIIDAAKHHLDYKRSEKEQGIAALKKQYRGSSNAGAATLISRANKEIEVPSRKLDTHNPNLKGGIDPETGEKVYINTNKTKPIPKDRDEDGKVTEWDYKPVTVTTTMMKEVSDARVLMSGPDHSGTLAERRYADYANKMKALANACRKEALAIEKPSINPSAKEAYAAEVDTLLSKINIAAKNKPLERIAQVIANVEISNARKDNPSMSKDDAKKLNTQVIAEARRRVGANKIDSSIKITDKEWEAIQAGAISATKLREILASTDMDRVRELAMPIDKVGFSASEKNLIKNYVRAGFTTGEIAERLGVSSSTVSRYLNEQKGA